MELKEKIEQRIEEIRKAREQKLAELQEFSRKELLPFDVAIGELQSLLNEEQEE